MGSGGIVKFMLQTFHLFIKTNQGYYLNERWMQKESWVGMRPENVGNTFMHSLKDIASQKDLWTTTINMFLANSMVLDKGIAHILQVQTLGEKDDASWLYNLLVLMLPLCIVLWCMNHLFIIIYVLPDITANISSKFTW